MSGEQLTPENTVKTQEVGSGEKLGNSKSTGRVDINTLMNKVRDQEKKQKKENLVFFGLISSVVVVTGIIASL
tara:strand:+ start:215 stop:433 length:219 start_codon:yes stop_codon:yes gene_type:complete